MAGRHGKVALDTWRMNEIHTVQRLRVRTLPYPQLAIGFLILTSPGTKWTEATCSSCFGAEFGSPLGGVVSLKGKGMKWMGWV